RKARLIGWLRALWIPRREGYGICQAAARRHREQETAMRAVVRRNKQLVCDEIGELEPAEGQVLVKTLACGICGSDLHALHHMEHMVELGRRAGGADNGFDP